MKYLAGAVLGGIGLMVALILLADGPSEENTGPAAKGGEIETRSVVGVEDNVQEEKRQIVGDDKVPNGASCMKNSDCKSNQCSFGTCKSVKKRKNGEKCWSDQDCRSGECKSFVCQKLQHPKVRNGKKCVVDGDCKSGRCEGWNPLKRKCVRR